MYFFKDIDTQHKSNLPNSERTIYGSFVFWFGLGLSLIVIDQLAKYLFSRERHFKNYNFAFSLPIPPQLMYVIYAVILGAICYHIAKNYRYFNKAQTFAWILIISGAISNIGERLVLGYVRDFIYILTGIFNLADSYIVSGIILLLFKSKKLRI